MTAEPESLTLANPVTMADVMESQRVFPFFEIHTAGIKLSDNCPEETWRDLAKHTVDAFEATGVSHCRMMAKLADVLNFGFAKYGERASAVIQATAGFMRLKVKTLDNAMEAFLRIPEERRRVDELTLEHHKAVQKLSADEQVEFLQLAIDEGMNVEALREAVKERHPSNSAKKATKKKASTSDKITKKDCLAAFQTIEDFVIQMEEEHGSAGRWPKEMKSDFIAPAKSLNKVLRRLAIPSHGKK